MDNRHNRKLFENALQEVNQKSQPKQLNEVIGTLIGLGILGGAAYKFAKDWSAEKKARQEESETKALERRALISKIEEPANQRAFTAQQNELARQAKEAEQLANRTFTTSEREAGQTFKSGETEKQIAARQAEQGANRTFTTSEREASQQAARKRAADERKFKRGEGNKARRERASIRKEEGKKAAAQIAAGAEKEKTRRQEAAISGLTRRRSAQSAAELSAARVEKLKAETAAIDPANRDEVLSLVNAQAASMGTALSSIMKKLESMSSPVPTAPSSAPAPSGSSAPKRRTSKKSTATPPAAAPSPKKKATKKSTATPSAPPPATGTPASGKKKISDEPSSGELARMEAVKAAIRAENIKKKKASKPKTIGGFDPDADEDNF